MQTIKGGLASFWLVLTGLFAICTVANGQENAAARAIRQKFGQFDHPLKEKIYLHTDKNYYLAGEIIWFKIYYLDATTYRPRQGSKIVYGEILDTHSNPILQAKITLDSSGGQGSFYLPVSLSSGNYVLRTYTNWMKNFGPAGYFEKTISILNTIKAPSAEKSQDPEKITAGFFPEGGHLVEGLETKMGFRITDNTGRGIDAEGVIVNQGGDSLVRFSTTRYGIGSFIFKPEAGHLYRALISIAGKNVLAQSLPDAESYGYVMNVTDNGDDRIIVRVRAKKQLSGREGEEVYLLVHARQSMKILRQGYVRYDNELRFLLQKDELDEGISNVTLFNADQQAVCERLVFIRPRQKQAPGLSADKASYKPREEVNISLGGPDDSINCSVSVFQIDSLQDLYGENIVSYLLLTSDLRGLVEHPAYYFSDDEGVEKAADNLLLTQGWRRFKWTDAPAVIKFKPEYHEHFITGRIVNITTGSLVANAQTYLTVPANPYGLYLGLSDSTGLVHFPVKDYYGPGDIIAQVAENNKSNYRVDIMTPFAADPAWISPPRLLVSPGDEEIFVQKSIGMQAQNIYRADSLRKFRSPDLPDTLPFYGRAELSYPLDKYKRFTTMEEVLREYVMAVNVLFRNNKLSLSIFDEVSRLIYREGMLVLLDGVPLENPHSIFGYDPLKVKKLEVIPRRYVLGSRLFYGILSLETYKHSFDGFNLDSSLIAVDYEGLQLQREFYSPAYTPDNRQEKIPDMRSTLYWIPDVSLAGAQKSLIHFFTSDLRGRYRIVVEGISKRGKPVMAVTSFIVR